MQKYLNGQYVEMTPEEVAQIERERKAYEAYERRRPLTQEEVTLMLTKQQINTVEVDDQTSIRMLPFYPTFDEIVGQKVKQGFKFTHNGKLYKTAQPELAIQAHYQPGQGTESLYTRIDEVHTGDEFDPIPYEGNMALVNGKHYIQNGVTYLCNRDTGNPVHHALKDLVGLYVQPV